jgi:hypothetical protein
MHIHSAWHAPRTFHPRLLHAPDKPDIGLNTCAALYAAR